MSKPKDFFKGPSVQILLALFIILILSEHLRACLFGVFYEYIKCVIDHIVKSTDKTNFAAIFKRIWELQLEPLTG